MSGNREQAERLREAPAASDFYAPVAQAFTADPRRTDEPALNFLRGLVLPGETWLDIGAGGGRNALPLALLAKEVIALDPSEGMLAALAASAAEHGIENVRAVYARWPLPEPIEADVCLISHVAYDIEEIGPFLDGMERAARRICVAVLLAESPASVAATFWPDVMGEERVPLPALPQFLALQLARGRLCEVRLLERPPMSYHTRDAAISFLRQQLFVAEGSERDRKLATLVGERLSETGGRWSLQRTSPPLGVVTWQPPAAL